MGFPNSIIAPLMAMAAAGLMAACGGGGGGGGTASVGQGTVSVALTDAPSCGFSHVYVTVAKVRVHQSADPNVPDADAGWHDISLSAPTRIDLTSLTNGVLYALGTTTLTAGTYEQVRLVLVPNSGGSAPYANAVVATGSATEMPLSTPSAVQSGIKLIRPFTVAANAQVDLVLDFNACKSVVTAGASGRYNLKPVLTMATVAASGTIEGWVDPTVAAAAPVTVSAQVVDAGGNVTEVKSTVAAPAADAANNIAAGQFILGLVPLTSAQPGNYNIVITADGHTTTVLTGVSVASAARVDVNSATSPLALPTSATHTAGGIVTMAGAASIDATIAALQTLTTSLPVQVASANADATTGAYSLTLPIAATQYAPFVNATTAPVFANATASAGQFTLLAVPAIGASQSFAVDVSAGDMTHNFAF